MKIQRDTPMWALAHILVEFWIMVFCIINALCKNIFLHFSSYIVRWCGYAQLDLHTFGWGFLFLHYAVHWGPWTMPPPTPSLSIASAGLPGPTLSLFTSEAVVLVKLQHCLTCIFEVKVFTGFICSVKLAEVINMKRNVLCGFVYCDTELAQWFELIVKVLIDHKNS